jgi:hypothetical protein
MTNDEERMTGNTRRLNDKPRRKFGVDPPLSLLFIFALCASSLLWCGCFGPRNSEPRDPTPHLVGRISGNSYTSPRGDFAVPFPVSPEVGGRILRDDSQSVTFRDNWGSKISFYSKPFNPQSAMKSPAQSQERARALETFMKDIYGDSIEPHYHPDILDGTVSFIQLKPVGPKVGIATFIHENRVYLVETDLLPGVELLSRDDEASQKARDEWLENRAIDLLRSMEIR